MMRSFLVYILLCCIHFALQAKNADSTDSPYSWAGDSTITLTAQNANSENTFVINIVSDSGTHLKASFDFKHKTVQVTDNSNQVIFADTIASGISAFLTIDPKAENYYSVSPYAFCANNPIKFIDPTGMVIEENSKSEWNRLRGEIEAERNKIQKQINELETQAAKKGWSADKLSAQIGDRSERVASLNTSLETMTVLANSSQVYRLAHVNGTGFLNYDSRANIISINFEGDYNFVHEVTHAGQFEVGELAFSENGNTLLQDVFDETAAYKAQYAFNPGSLSSINSASKPNSINDITSSWVQTVRDWSGTLLYAPGGVNNTGLIPVNINSTRNTLIEAYPWIATSLQNQPDDFNARSIIGIYYKK